MAKKKQKKSKTKIAKKVNITHVNNLNMLAKLIATKDYTGLRLLLDECINLQNQSNSNLEWISCFRRYFKESESFCWNICILIQKQIGFTRNNNFCRQAVVQLNDFIAENADASFVMASVTQRASELSEQALEDSSNDPELFIKLALLRDTADRLYYCIEDIHQTMKNSICSKTLNYLELKDKVVNF